MNRDARSDPIHERVIAWDKISMHDAQCTPPVTDALVDEVATATYADPRSVVRRLAGLPVRGRRGEAIDRELETRGIHPKAQR